MDGAQRQAARSATLCPRSSTRSPRHLKQLEIEREAIKRENDEDKIKQLDKEIADPEGQGTSVPRQMGGEEGGQQEFMRMATRWGNSVWKARRTRREGDYGRVKYAMASSSSSKRHRQHPTAVREAAQGAETMVREEVTADDS